MGGYISKYAYGATYKLDNVVESTVTVDDEVSTKIVEASKEVVEPSKEVVEPAKEVVEPSTEVSTKIVEPSTEVSVSSDSSDATGIFESISRNNKKKKGKKPKKD